MLRFDPGDSRIRTARSFRVWEGGGEYNVARGLRKCFGLKEAAVTANLFARTAAVTALADNEIGRLVEDFMLQGGVDTSLIKWVKYDGIGRTVRNGLNFTERGYGIRGALGVSDRGNTASSQLKEAISTGSTFSALSVLDGFTRAGFLPHSPTQRLRLLSKPLKQRKNTEQQFPMTSITDRLFGAISAARRRLKRSTGRSQNISTS